MLIQCRFLVEHRSACVTRDRALVGLLLGVRLGITASSTATGEMRLERLEIATLAAAPLALESARLVQPVMSVKVRDRLSAETAQISLWLRLEMDHEDVLPQEECREE